MLLVVNVTLILVCRKGRKFSRGLQKRQYIVRNSAPVLYNAPLTAPKNQMRRFHPLKNYSSLSNPIAGSIMMENQGKGEESNKDAQEGKESLSPAIQNDKSLKAAQAKLPSEKRRNLLGKGNCWLKLGKYPLL